jgi:5-methylcytosine-specific restriction endonuclease McrA
MNRIITPERRAYLQKYQQEWLQKRRDAWLKLNGPCKNCGSSENLEVDHIDRTKKVTHRVWSWAKKRQVRELSKCQVLCKPCHIEKTAKDMNYRQHGTAGYKRGCRCQVCTDAAIQKVNEWRWKTGRRKKRI